MLLAFTILAGSVPVVSGIVFQPSGEAIALDICHPRQVVVAVSTQCSVPVLSLFILTPRLDDCGRIAEPDRITIARAAEAPDPPPPKA